MSSLAPLDPTNALPVTQAPIPADVKQAGSKAEQLYTTAVGFEQLLLQQLTSELDATTQSSDSSSSDDSSDPSSSDDSDPSMSSMLQLLPDALAQSISSAGGLGMARELYNSMAANAGIVTDPVAQTVPVSAADNVSDASSSGPAGGGLA